MWEKLLACLLSRKDLIAWFDGRVEVLSWNLPLSF